MITVLQVVNEMGVAQSPLMLTIYGILVKRRLSVYVHNIVKIAQEENGQTIYVNCYNEKYHDDIKRIIKGFLTKKMRKREWMELMVETRRYRIDRKQRYVRGVEGLILKKNNERPYSNKVVAQHDAVRAQ